mgnify:CR=1 FL=1|tara:strand:- start:14 stop:313 length:300 start_codon:yes stop_codon:yes gene_type:complete
MFEKVNKFWFYGLCGTLMILTFLSLFGAAIYDEGMGDNLFLRVSYWAFHLFRFPTHVFWEGSMNSTGFFGGLIFNCFFNAFVIERIVSVIRTSKKGIGY